MCLHLHNECASNFSFSHIILAAVKCAYNLVFRFKLCVKSRTGANMCMTFEAAKCEVLSAHWTKRDNKAQQKSNKICALEYIGLRRLSKQFYLLAITIIAWFEASQQQKHIHNFRLIITKPYRKRWNKSDRECKVCEKRNGSVESLGMEPQMI